MAKDNLLSNPSTLERLRNELLTTDLSKPCPKWAEVSGLPFLDACIQEGLRRKLIPEHSCTRQGVRRDPYQPFFQGHPAQ